MSTTTDTSTEEQAPESAVEPTEPPEGSPGTPDEAETFPRSYVEELRRENAEQRTKAKRGDALARQLVLSYAQALGRLADPTDLPFDEALCDDDGIPDPARIADAVDELLTRKPHLGDRRPRGDVGQGATVDPSAVDLASMLRARAG